MKTIKMSEMPNDGVYIDLDVSFIPYQKILFNPSKYFNMYTKYYFHCKHGIKSKEVVNYLSRLGYNVTQVV